ncbi:DUF3413 domain-containing protein [Histophilus somni]|uniref:DUF3413 domain-containing protein n=1 Tax=Histophilus somni TaxID=731 RepID=UPI00109C1328|nr:DUF3413 domain-containing protein [Histophilus somni]QEH18595.1 DUF3413 domain-containing protein [Histophilus somni]THA20896.1 DUF3413 domain-containing protein [Histophilus somni]
MFGIKTSKQYRDELSRKITWGHWFAFFNILWAIVIGSRYAFIIDWPHTLFGKIYFFISLLGHFSFIVFALYLLALFPLSFIIKNERTFRGISVILTTIGATLLLVDTEVFSRFNLHLSTLVWNLLVNPDDGKLSYKWQIFFAPMPLILFVQMLFSRWAWYKLRSLERQKWIKGVALVFVVSFIATHILYAWADAYIYRPITMQKSNFPLSYPMTARSFLEKHGFLNKSEYEKTLNEQGRLDALKVNYPKQKLTFSDELPKTNIVLITISGLRHDAVRQDIMPNLFAFSENSTEFTHHYSSGNSLNQGLTGLFYGLNANYADSLLSNKTTPVLIEQLKQGKVRYEIGLFGQNLSRSALLKKSIFANEKIRNDSNAFTQRFIEFVNTRKQQQKLFFAYLTYSLNSNLTIEQYYQKLSEIDDEIGSAFKSIDFTHTIVIVTSEYGYSFDFSDKKRPTNYFAREVIQVPMIIRWENLPIGKVNKLSSHTDLVPALMKHIFKVKNPISDFSQGQDLFDLDDNRSWVLAGNYRWNVIITPDDSQYHIDRNGHYQKYNQHYQKISSTQPPLGLFLEVFSQNTAFIEK